MCAVADGIITGCIEKLDGSGSGKPGGMNPGKKGRCVGKDAVVADEDEDEDDDTEDDVDDEEEEDDDDDVAVEAAAATAAAAAAAAAAEERTCMGFNNEAPCCNCLSC